MLREQVSQGLGMTPGFDFKFKKKTANELGERGVAIGGADARMAVEFVVDGDGDVLHGCDWRARDDGGLPPPISIVRAGAVIICKMGWERGNAAMELPYGTRGENPPWSRPLSESCSLHRQSHQQDKLFLHGAHEPCSSYRTQ